MSLADTIQHINMPFKTEEFLIEKGNIFRLNESGQKIHRIRDRSIKSFLGRMIGHRYLLVER